MITDIGPKGTAMRHNEDFSGGVFVAAGQSRERGVAEIPFPDLEWLVLLYLARKRIEQLKQASPEDLERMFLPGLDERIEPRVG